MRFKDMHMYKYQDFQGAEYSLDLLLGEFAHLEWCGTNKGYAERCQDVLAICVENSQSTINMDEKMHQNSLIARTVNITSLVSNWLWRVYNSTEISRCVNTAQWPMMSM